MTGIPSQYGQWLHIVKVTHSAINLIMRSDVDRDDLFVFDQKFNGQPMAHGDGNGMESAQFAPQRMNTQGWVERICLHEEQAFLVLAQEFRVGLEEFSRPADVAFREDDREIIHRQGF